MVAELHFKMSMINFKSFSCTLSHSQLIFLIWNLSFHIFFTYEVMKKKWKKMLNVFVSKGNEFFYSVRRKSQP